MNNNCEICGANIYDYNTQIIEYDYRKILSCKECKKHFDMLIEGDTNEIISESKRYFSSLEYGRFYSEILVNDYPVHYIKKRDDFNAEDLKGLSESLNKSNHQNKIFYNYTKEELKVLHTLSDTLSDNISYIKKVAKFFYYVSIISLSFSAFYLFIKLFGLLL